MTTLFISIIYMHLIGLILRKHLKQIQKLLLLKLKNGLHFQDKEHGMQMKMYIFK